jgi:hypothetical protein
VLRSFRIARSLKDGWGRGRSLLIVNDFKGEAKPGSISPRALKMRN